MRPAQRALMRRANALMVWLYRSSGGKVMGKAKGGTPVLLLTAPGRRSGIPHTVPVSYLERNGG